MPKEPKALCCRRFFSMSFSIALKNPCVGTTRATAMPYYKVRYKLDADADHRGWALGEHPSRDAALTHFNNTDAKAEDLGSFVFDEASPSATDYYLTEQATLKDVEQFFHISKNPLRVVPPPMGWVDAGDGGNNVARQYYERQARFTAAQQFSGTANPLGPTAGVESQASLVLRIAAVERQHEEMLKRITAIEDTIAKLKPTPPGIGHNQPPPLSGIEIEEIWRDIIEVKTKPAVPKEPPDDALATASRLTASGERVLGYCAKQADNFATEMVKSAGKAVPIWALFGNQLIALGASIEQWLSALKHLLAG
jgi:hypothetical protein